MKVFFSNRYEVLVERLRDELFFTPCHPFAKRWVVVPSQTVKNDLLYRFARDEKLCVATGVQILTLGQALHSFFPQVPSMMELSLKIEANLEKSGSIQEYLKGGGTKRLTGLCDQLGALFLKQGTFRGKPFAAMWLEELWQKVKPSWESTQDIDFPIYLFNISFLPERYLEFFKAAARSGFFISPTELYWGDVATPHEQRFFLNEASGGQKKELEGYFQDQNQLIAHLGKMGRRLWMQLQDEESEECYVEPEGFALHTQMFHLESVQIDNGKVDDAVEIHAAPSKSREVEIVWEIMQHHDDVLVLAPDINEYVPYIHKVFEGTDYTISGLEMRLEHVEHLFKIPQLKYSVEAVLKLFSYPSFLGKFGFSTEDVFFIKKWAEQANFHVGNWEEGFERMLRALATIPEEDDPAIEFSQAELLGQWIEVLKLLKKELEPIEKNLSMGADAWMEYFQKTVCQFFVIQTEEIFFSELHRCAKINTGNYSFESIERVIEEIFGKKTGVFQGSQLQAVRFASLAAGSIVPARCIFVMGMEEGRFPRIEKKNSLGKIEGDYCPTVAEEDRYLFLELILAARERLILTYPAIDPQDGKEMRPSLLIEELFSEVKVHHHPKLPFDKSYFQEDGFRSHSELYFRAAESYYEDSLSAKAESFPKKQLAPFQGTFGSVSLSDRGASRVTNTQTVSSNNKKEKGPLKSLFSIPDTLSKKEEAVIDIRHLKKLARHPIQFFFEKKLGIYFEREKRKNKEFVLSHLDLAYFRRASRTKDLKEIVTLAEQKGKLPLGPFRDVAIQRIEEDVAEYQNALAALEIDQQALFSIEFKASCDAAFEMRKGEWVAPPLEVGMIKIVGRLEDLCPQGLIFHGEDKWEDWLKAWPLYLIALHLPIEPNLLLTKKGVKKENFFSEPKEALSRYLDYYQTALENLSILMPKWGKSILEKGVVEPDNESDEILEWFLERDSMSWSDEWMEKWTPLLKETYREVL